MAMENPTIELSHQNHNLVRDFPSSHSWSVYIPIYSSISHFVHLYSLLHPNNHLTIPHSTTISHSTTIQPPFNHHLTTISHGETAPFPPWISPIRAVPLARRTWSWSTCDAAMRRRRSDWSAWRRPGSWPKRKGSREKYMDVGQNGRPRGPQMLV